MPTYTLRDHHEPIAHFNYSRDAVLVRDWFMQTDPFGEYTITEDDR